MSVDVFAIADDGAVLASDLGLTGPTLYRLPAGTQQWQSLGLVPDSDENAATVTYVPTPANRYIQSSAHRIAEYVP